MERQIYPFTTRAGFGAQLTACLDRAEHTLCLFDPDFAIWDLGSSERDAQLRRFFQRGGQLRLAAHDAGYLVRNAPRFLRLLTDYAHLIECRRTSRALRQLTDSFCIADERDMVRRFHAAHFRGEAVFNSPPDTETCHERFITIWSESTVKLHANSTGL